MPLVLLALLLGASPPPVRADTGDTAVAAARAALARGNAWRASLLLAPVLSDSVRRTPTRILLAATAASRWGGWAEVRTILGAAPWLDTLEGGAGRELLTRAALGLGDDSAAESNGRRALAAAGDPRTSAVRRVLLARALDRLGRLDDAGMQYAAAATALPAAADWLRLRAVAALSGGVAGAVQGPAQADSLVQAHAGAAIAAALERRRAWRPAHDAYLQLNDTSDALRVALLAGPDSATRAATLAFLDVPRPRAVLQQLVPAVDQALPRLSPAEQLVVARAAARGGLADRAVAGFDTAFAAGLGTVADRMDRAAALVRAGRAAEAVGAYHVLAGDRVVGVRALYEEARTDLRLQRNDAARRLFTLVAERHRADSALAAGALFLLADQAVDAGDDAGARRWWDRLATRYPKDRLAPAARFQSALVRWIRRDYHGAAKAFDALRDPVVGAGEANAAGYWAGRAWEVRGDTARAHTRWREVIARAPDSYYATASARRLGVYRLPAGLRDSAGPVRSLAALDSGASRIRRLREIGLDQEAGWELDALAAARGGPDTLLAVATTLLALDEPARAARVARVALAAGADSVAALHLLFPVAAPEVLVHQARERGSDPALAAALIRQESGFDPDAVSAAGARGLMQVMPAVGAALARRLHYPLWDPVLLYQPDVNLELGLAHLERLLARFPRPEQVLAAYNAGGSKVLQWSQRHGTVDPEVFIERIPFAETRDYVRIVLRDREVYRGVYGW